MANAQHVAAETKEALLVTQPARSKFTVVG
jgi:hypothetical protein